MIESDKSFLYNKVLSLFQKKVQHLGREIVIKTDVYKLIEPIC